MKRALLLGGEVASGATGDEHGTAVPGYEGAGRAAADVDEGRSGDDAVGGDGGNIGGLIRGSQLAGGAGDCGGGC